MSASLPLSKCKLQCFKIKELIGDDTLVCQLCELGFLPGSEGELIGTTPFNGPLMIRLKETKIALRRKEADAILVHA